MKNVEMKLEGNILTIKVDITKEYGVSSSGKSIITLQPKATSRLSRNTMSRSD